MQLSAILLKKGREKSVRQRHPWIFSGAVESLQGNPQPGENVEILDHQGTWLARAGYSPHSQIIARIWTWNPNESIDHLFFQSRVENARRLRIPLEGTTNAYRLVNAENDGLPGFILDRYADFFVLQALTAPADRWKAELADIAIHWPGIQGVYERSDVDVRKKEGLNPIRGVLAGKEPPESVIIQEREWQFLVDIPTGHKTGFYLDQRDNREILRNLISEYIRGGTGLNVFSYSGAFAVAAYSAGAESVVNIDSSQAALHMASRQLEANHFSFQEESFLCGNAFEILRGFRDSNRLEDFIILDPPKFVHSQRDIPKASRAYKDINWLAMRILRPGGLLFTFSCSGLMSDDLFQKIVFSAAVDAGRDAQILRRMGQPIDHPVRLSFPEGKYLKGLALRMV